MRVHALSWLQLLDAKHSHLYDTLYAPLLTLSEQTNMSLVSVRSKLLIFFRFKCVQSNVYKQKAMKLNKSIVCSAGPILQRSRRNPEYDFFYVSTITMFVVDLRIKHHVINSPSFSIHRQRVARRLQQIWMTMFSFT